MADQFAYSTDEETFFGSFDTREEAQEEGNAEAWDDEKAQFWTGRAVPYQPVVDADAVVEQLRNAAFDYANPELSEDWMASVTPAQLADLGASLTVAFNAWAAQHGHAPTFFAIADVQEHAVTPEEEPA